VRVGVVLSVAMILDPPRLNFCNLAVTGPRTVHRRLTANAAAVLPRGVDACS